MKKNCNEANSEASAIGGTKQLSSWLLFVSNCDHNKNILSKLVVVQNAIYTMHFGLNLVYVASSRFKIYNRLSQHLRSKIVVLFMAFFCARDEALYYTVSFRLAFINELLVKKGSHFLSTKRVSVVAYVCVAKYQLRIVKKRMKSVSSNLKLFSAFMIKNSVKFSLLFELRSI